MPHYCHTLSRFRASHLRFAHVPDVDVRVHQAREHDAVLPREVDHLRDAGGLLVRVELW
jgi:hypothetical protein